MNKRVFKAVTMVTQISISMMAPIFLCVFIGYQLDKKFETGFWFLIFLVLGFLTAIRNVYYLTKCFYAKDKDQEDAEMEYIENLKRCNQNYQSEKKQRK